MTILSLSRLCPGYGQKDTKSYNKGCAESRAEENPSPHRGETDVGYKKSNTYS